MRTVFLKIKIKALVAESKLIRAAEAVEKRHFAQAPEEEYKTEHLEVLGDLIAHRRGPVRYEARHSGLAYAFLRNVPYRKAENKTREGNAPDMDKIHKMVVRFGGERNQGEVEAWLEVA